MLIPSALPVAFQHGLEQGKKPGQFAGVTLELQRPVLDGFHQRPRLHLDHGPVSGLGVIPYQGEIGGGIASPVR